MNTDTEPRSSTEEYRALNATWQRFQCHLAAGLFYTPKKRRRPRTVPLDLELAADELLRRYQGEPDFMANLADYRLAFHKADLKTECAEFIQALQESPEYHAMLDQQDPGMVRERARQARSEFMRKQHQDPAFKAKFAAAWTPERRASWAETMELKRAAKKITHK